MNKNTRLWGGISGMIGAALFVLVMIFVTVFIPEGGVETEDLVLRFPGIMHLRVIENLVYLTALILQIPMLLALKHAFEKETRPFVRFGSAVTLLGLMAMAASATPHVAHYEISELFAVSGITGDQQMTIAFLWQAVWGVFYGMLYVGFFMTSLGLTAIGIGLFSSEAIKNRNAWVVCIFGGIGFITAVMQLADPGGDAGAGSYLGSIVCYIVLSIQVFRLRNSAE